MRQTDIRNISSKNSLIRKKFFFKAYFKSYNLKVNQEFNFIGMPKEISIYLSISVYMYIIHIYFFVCIKDQKELSKPVGPFSLYSRKLRFSL